MAVLEAGRMGSMRICDEESLTSVTSWWLDDWFRASPKAEFLFLVRSGQYQVSKKGTVVTRDRLVSLTIWSSFAAPTINCGSVWSTGPTQPCAKAWGLRWTTSSSMSIRRTSLSVARSRTRLSLLWSCWWLLWSSLRSLCRCSVSPSPPTKHKSCPHQDHTKFTHYF